MWFWRLRVSLLGRSFTAVCRRGWKVSLPAFAAPHANDRCRRTSATVAGPLPVYSCWSPSLFPRALEREFLAHDGVVAIAHAAERVEGQHVEDAVDQAVVADVRAACRCTAMTSCDRVSIATNFRPGRQAGLCREGPRRRSTGPFFATATRRLRQAWIPSRLAATPRCVTRSWKGTLLPAPSRRSWGRPKDVSLADAPCRRRQAWAPSTRCMIRLFEAFSAQSAQSLSLSGSVSPRRRPRGDQQRPRLLQICQLTAPLCQKITSC
jgi:hypothetical protein